MRAIPIGQSVQFRSFLTSAVLAIGDVVALNSGGLLVKADKSNGSLLNVVGFVMTASAGGAVITIPVRNGGLVQKAGWTFTIGLPVYLSSTGGVTQTTASFAGSDWIVELGTAIGVNQIQVGIQRAVANAATSGNQYAITAGAVYDALATNPGLLNKTIASATSTQVVDSIPIATYGAAHWLVCVKNGTTGRYASEIVAVDMGTGTTVDYAEYGIVQIGTFTTAPTFTVTSDSTSMILTFVGDAANSIVVNRQAV